MRFVLDNSISMRWLFHDGTETDLRYAELVLASLVKNTIFVPEIWWLEVINVIARAEAQEQLAETKSQKFLSMMCQIPIETDSLSQARAWENILPLAREYKLTSYDAAYLELAIRQNLALATLDNTLAKAAKLAGITLF
ncbi:MAG: type II toxin-antitoxin system VapC family toxin [Candidatus Thioglobus sp.]|nr:type II toxin-antitoxin system VapC family toxin [Candidatus Thioglobus sp.]